MAKLQKVLIMAGGTGGHVFPGLAIARLLRQKGIDVVWLGTRKGLEAKLVPAENIPLYFISISGVRGKGVKDIFLALFRLTIAIWQAARIIRKQKPDVVIGLGGFASGPGGIASWLLGYPLVIHEQNAKPGTTNKWLSRIAKKVLEGFPNTFLHRRKVEITGNPVREEIARLVCPQKGRHHPLQLLVLGGSLGAAAINELMPQALAKLPEESRPEVYHQTGEKHLSATISAYEQAGMSARIVPFIEKMDEAYVWADIVVCRAGALTVAELCAAGVGAILVPFPYAIDDHQTDNANFMVKQGAAILIQQSAITADKLADILLQMAESPEQCQKMAEAAYQLRKVDATDKVFRVCEEGSRGGR